MYNIFMVEIFKIIWVLIGVVMLLIPEQVLKFFKYDTAEERLKKEKELYKKTFPLFYILWFKGKEVPPKRVAVKIIPIVGIFFIIFALLF
jgi:hypothetical protein